jgi:hypothetical protein
MVRKAFAFGLIGLMLSHTPLSADAGEQPRPASGSSGTKRVVWTLVGIGAGFGAGLFLGLNAFDDSINSDRKVWTSALVGAAAGGLAGALLSRNIGRSPAMGGKALRVPAATAPHLPPLLEGIAPIANDGLRQRVRTVGREVRPPTTDRGVLPQLDHGHGPLEGARFD